MKRQTLVTAKREQDGCFALLLEQLRQAEENQSLLSGGIDPAEVFL